mgnify:CR=1 FL=1
MRYLPAVLVLSASDSVLTLSSMLSADYIRTYTWDKRIESWVKETTFLGGASKAGGPTVITPKQYKLRFREAIDGYLLLVRALSLSCSLSRMQSG